jgi:hypothetical protein
MRVTFLIRKRQLPGTALHNAARYDADYLKAVGHASEVIATPEGDMLPVLDTDLVVIEGACWVPVEMVQKLTRKHRVIVRVHAAPAFLYFEFPGQSATDYCKACRALGVTIAYVSEELAERFNAAALPIVYPVGPLPEWEHSLTAAVHSVRADRVDIGAFGAMRPLKNHMGMLFDVIKARDTWFKDRAFYFHVNATRAEDRGHYILGELKSVCRETGIHLVGHDWIEPAKFKAEVIPSMTVGMFGTFAESFCLTAADFVAAGVPSVLSNSIPWAGIRGSLVDQLYECIVRPHE